ncbi:bifunctional oligoribonuclease/PAP phosphatase NrnA [Lentisphaerota bacterium ZTH]|nr:bifunctional oligoribonuclease/PAP phosphatase NrnA [Lentisphaerota bacterium]WET07629.1 bifunctional oligoribonuclease/PAP phosphatase NrnA [Lentisphaerota bacterium ZTH]
MMKNSVTPHEAAEIIRQHDNFLVVTHENPDGDALGSAFALLNFLHDNGKMAEALLPEELPEKYRTFASSDCRTEMTLSDLATFDCVIMLDIPNAKRAALSHIDFNGIPLPVMNIDHHPDNVFYAKWNLVDPQAAATADILFTVFRSGKGAKISARTAELLLLGIVMDTGGFRFDNTSPKVLRHAAEILELKADYHKIIKQMFFSNPLPQQQFQAELQLHHLRTAFNGRFAWFFIPPELVRKYNVDMRNTEGLIEALRAIRGTEIVAIIQPAEQGFKLSLRSKSPCFSVGAIARKLNGGGHEMAAGGLIKASCLENAEKILLTHVERELNAI